MCDQKTVLKLGGSLLDVPNIAGRLEAFVLGQEISNAIIVVGGGRAADAVREWDNTAEAPAATTHRLAIAAMAQNARQFANAHSSFHWGVRDSDAGGMITILDVVGEMQTLESSCDPHDMLPASWDVTSDSIAAWICHQWNAAGLILLKSVDHPESTLPLFPIAKGTRRAHLEQLACRNLVDPAFPEQASGVAQLSWCNLRSGMDVCQQLW